MSKQKSQTDLKKQFLDLYEGHADALFRFTYYKLSDREKAKDTVQDTFVKLMAQPTEAVNGHAGFFVKPSAS